MVRYKVNHPDDSKKFVNTQAYNKLYGLLKELKTLRGRIIHVTGAPGTGKSANIYQAINKLQLDVYEPKLVLDDFDDPHASNVDI